MLCLHYSAVSFIYHSRVSAIPQTYPKIRKCLDNSASPLPPLVTTPAEELDGGGDNKTVVWLEDVGALMVTGLRWRRKKTIMTSRLS
ncbi:unnamed protein product [Brassica rapa subsp. narinosa]